MGVFAWIRELSRGSSCGSSKAKRWDQRSLAPILRVRRLEERRVLNAEAAPLNQLVIDAGDAAADGQADTFRVEQSADDVRISVNGQEVSRTPVGQLGQITIQGSLDDDILIAEFKAGEPLAGLELLFDGGNSGADSLTLIGGDSFDTVTHHFAEAGVNRVAFGSDSALSTVTYVGLEAVDDQLTAENRVFHFEAGGQQITLDDFGSATDDLSSIIVTDSVGLGRELTVAFRNPTNSLAIETHASAEKTDSIGLAGVDRNFNADLRVLGSEDDVLTVLGPIDAGQGDIDLVVGTVNLEGSLTTSGANVRFDATQAVFIGEEGVVRNDSGTIRIDAPSIEHHGLIAAQGGQVRLDSGDDGTTIVHGIIDVSTTDAELSAGTVHLLGSHVGLFDNARIDASAAIAGGLVLIGGDYQGKNPLVRNAARTYVGPNAVIRADATLLGNGGKVVVWADEVTRFYGTITARGGSQGGDGGFAEVSGKEALVYLGFTDLRAEHGALGTLLLDPKNITIENGGADDIVNENEFAEAPDEDKSFDASQVVAALVGANLELQANTDIIVNEAIDARGNNNPGNLTLRAGRSVIINQSIFIEGTLTVTVDDPGAVAAQRDPGPAQITIGGGVTLDTSEENGDVVFNGTINADNAAANNRTLTVNAGTGTVTFDGAIGNTQALADLDVTAATINLNSPTVTVDDQGGNTLTFTGAVVLGANVAIDTDGASDNSVLFDGIINADVAGRNLTVIAGSGNVSFAGAVGGVTPLAELTASGATISLMDVTTTGNQSYTGTVLVTIGGAINSASGNVVVAGGTVNQNGNITTGGAGNVSVTANAVDITMANGATTTTATGSITYLASGNVQLGRLTSSMNGAISVTATAGSITDNNGTANNIATTGNLILDAGTSVGTITTFAAANVGDDSNGAGNAIEIAVGTNSIMMVMAPTIHLLQTGALTIAANTIDIVGKGQAIIHATGNLNAGAINAIALTGDDNLALITQGILTIPAAGFNTATTATPGNLRMIGSDDVVAGGGDLIFRADDLFFHSGGQGGNATLDTNITSLTARLDANNLVVNETLNVNNDIRLDQVLTIAGTATMTTAGGGAGDINVGLVEAAAGTQAATLNADGSINTLNDNAVADIEGSTINLTARLGIGTNANHLDVTAASALNANTTVASTDIFIDSIGSLPVGLVNAGAGTGDVALTSTTNINDANGGGANNITAVNLTATAATGIDVDTTVANLTATTSGAGNIAIRESDGADLLNVAAASGDVGVSTAAGNLNAGIVSASATATLAATTGSIRSLNDNNIPDVSGNTINLTAAVEIGTNAAHLDVTAASSLNADTTAALSNIFIDSIGNLPLGLVTAGVGTGDVTLNSTADIVDANVGSLNIAANDLLMNAAAGIGAADPIDTNVSVLAADGGSGGLLVTNQNALEIGAVSGQAGATAADDVRIETLAGNLTVIEPVSSTGQSVTLQGAGNLQLNAAVTANQDVTGMAGADLNSMQPVTATTGSVMLDAANDANLDAAVTANQNLSAIAGQDLTTTQPVMATTGSVTLNAGNNANLGGAVMANQNVTGIAGNDLTTTQPVMSAMGSVAIGAGDNVTLNSDVIATNAVNGMITVEAGSNDLTTDLTDITLGPDTDLVARGGRITDEILIILDGRFAALRDSSDLTFPGLSGSQRVGNIQVRVNDPTGTNFEITIDWTEGTANPPPLPVDIPNNDPDAETRARQVRTVLNGFDGITVNNFRHEFLTNPQPNASFDIPVPVHITALAQGTIQLIINDQPVVDALSNTNQIGIMTVVLVDVLDLPTVVPLPPEAAPLPKTPQSPPVIAANIETVSRPLEQRTALPLESSANITAEDEDRYYELRVVIFDDEGNLIEDPEARIDLDDPRLEAIKPFSLSKLPALFGRLPADRYRIYLIEEGVERLILEFTIQQGQPVETSELGEEETTPEAPQPDPFTDDSNESPNLDDQPSDTSEPQPVEVVPPMTEGTSIHGPVLPAADTEPAFNDSPPPESFAERFASAPFFSHGGIVIGAAALAATTGERWQKSADRLMECFGRRRPFTRRGRKVEAESNGANASSRAEPQLTI